MNWKFDGDIAEPLNRLCREQMKQRLWLDIRADIEVCRLEGWDCKEYISELKEIMDLFLTNL